MKKILTVLKRTGLDYTIDQVNDGTFLEKEITINGKKHIAVITESIFTTGIEVSIERPRSATPYSHKSFTSESKVISYLHSQGVI